MVLSFVKTVDHPAREQIIFYYKAIFNYRSGPIIIASKVDFAVVCLIEIINEVMRKTVGCCIIREFVTVVLADPFPGCNPQESF
jgi:hypothetical protein